METLTTPGAAQVAKTTYDARDFQTKAISKMKGFKGDEKAWPGWRYKFRSGCLLHLEPRASDLKTQQKTKN